MWYVIDKVTNKVLEERESLLSCEVCVIDSYNEKDIRITSAKLYHQQYGETK